MVTVAVLPLLPSRERHRADGRMHGRRLGGWWATWAVEAGEIVGGHVVGRAVGGATIVVERHRAFAYVTKRAV